jgi:F-type H+-transporting ATPase subunit b
VNISGTRRLKRAAFPAACAAILLAAGTAWAGEGGEPGWRATWDLAMLWVNFAILAFFIVKYLRAPLMNFLRDESGRTAEAIREAEERKRRMDAQLQETQDAIEHSRERLAAITERIVAEAERRRQEVIESARLESRLMLERARLGTAHQLAEAFAGLKAELIDAAAAAALERLPALIRPEDQQKLIERFIREA